MGERPQPGPAEACTQVPSSRNRRRQAPTRTVSQGYSYISPEQAKSETQQSVAQSFEQRALVRENAIATARRSGNVERPIDNGGWRCDESAD